MEYDAKNDVFVSVCFELPGQVKALITVDNDGNNFILVNECLSEEARKEAIEHEYKHLKRNDLYSDKPAHVIEQEMNE